MGHYKDSNFENMNLVLHWDGVEWQMVTVPNPSNDWNDLSGVVALDNGEVWAVGDYNMNGGTSQTQMLHFDGGDWEIYDSPFIQGGSALNAVYGFSPDDVWAVGLRVTPEPIGQLLA